MIKRLMLLFSLFLISFNCNITPGPDETGVASEQACVLGTIAFLREQERGRNCDVCLAGMLVYCNKKESKQLIQF